MDLIKLSGMNFKSSIIRGIKNFVDFKRYFKFLCFFNRKAVY